MPAVAAQALHAVLRTVGPHTAVRYLGFATGRGIGGADDAEWEGASGDARQAAVGLEGVAEAVDAEEESMAQEGEGRMERENDGDERGEREERGKGKGKERERERARESLLADKLNTLDVPASRPEPMSISAETTPTDSAPSSPRKECPAPVSDTDTDSEMELATDEHAPAHASVRSLALPEPHYYYGAFSDKVGEAAACWLARWGLDILQYELELRAGQGAGAGASAHVKWETSASTSGQGEGKTAMRKRTATAPSRFPDSVGGGSTSASGSSSGSGGGWQRGREKEKLAEPVVPVVWRPGGLSARWVRGLLSSDAFFVHGERERYDVAKTVVEMRRAEGLDEADEQEWEELFRSGIYYENMVLDDLMAIARDVSPTTGRTYVPIAVLQSAHWNQDVLRHRITAKRPGGSSPPTSPTTRDKELGITLTASDVVARPDRDTPLYPVTGDASTRIGDSTGIDGASTDQPFELAASSSTDSSKKGAPTCEANFFGLQQQRVAAADIAAGAQGKWTAHPPFRFAVEFWDVDALKEKNRLHSHTVWYAGSLYNVYVQVVRKKGVQLGVYLHRQSTVDPLPPCSAPSAVATRALTAGAGAGQPPASAHQTRPASGSVSTPQRPTSAHSSPQNATFSAPGLPFLPLSRSTTPVSTAAAAVAGSLPSASSSTTLNTPAAANTLPATAPPAGPQQPYRDPRQAVSAYFAIACASATGASLTRFVSAPDVFAVSQSWGWKSSSLRTEEYIDVGADSGQNAGPPGREVSLRVTVVLGVV
ncbi:hypothetical protein WOLCODRAFT_134995 [Wolfiporia cocos MD-104 SS10]|uniref:Uncharacterized protein n=1 Tax=Wolfiporia cocos (strain MD-104) TaxID=742152 RepID=A0A2H3IT86_WOLCO|nr:hypothetical protein WOLCODRAFT_134995 [Wolfiporia cocos MD-104 SS10]